MALPAEFKEKIDTPTMKIKRFFKKITPTINLVLLVMMLYLTFVVSNKITLVILATDFNTLARVINIILVATIVYFFRKRK